MADEWGTLYNLGRRGNLEIWAWENLVAWARLYGLGEAMRHLAGRAPTVGRSSWKTFTQRSVPPSFTPFVPLPLVSPVFLLQIPWDGLGEGRVSDMDSAMGQRLLDLVRPAPTSDTHMPMHGILPAPYGLIVWPGISRPTQPHHLTIHGDHGTTNRDCVETLAWAASRDLR